MTVLLYSSQENKAWKEIKTAIIRTIGDKSSTRTVGSVAELREWLQQPRLEDQASIMLLYPARPADLDELLGLGNLLGSSRLIMVLPERAKDVVAKAHRLHPRFLTFIDGNCRALTDVLDKMLTKETVSEGSNRIRNKQADACL